VNTPKLMDYEELLPTRQSLLSRLKSCEDNDSWFDFFHTYWKFIYGIAVRSGLTDAEAQDVVQETIIAVSKQMPKFDSAKGSFKGWLFQQTKWRIQDQFRKRMRDSVLVSPPENDEQSNQGIESIASPDDREAIWEDEWQKNLIEAAAQRVKEKVNPKHFQMFDLYVLKKWPISKVTATLGVNVGQVYIARHRIAGLIKKEIKKLESEL
jgi:RNA polymerase sigma-70 factor (ECF subfamily)